MQKITPFLWFNTQAEEAIQHYTRSFQNASIGQLTRYPDLPFEPFVRLKGKIVTGVFTLAGHQFMALDGGPDFNFTPATSFFVNCETEEEIDALWSRLIEGGAELMPLQGYQFSPKFGWLKDRFGVSWQLNLEGEPQNITPFLMFVGDQDGHAEEAIKLYTSLFPDSGIDFVKHHDEHADKVQQAAFRLNGQPFMAMDGGTLHDFTFTEAISLHVSCETQEEIDRLWSALSAVPSSEQCGWLKDRFGVSWQIVPSVLGTLLNGDDAEKAQRVTNALLQMKKLDIDTLVNA